MAKGLFYSLGLSRKTFTTNFASFLAILVISLLTVTPLFYDPRYLMTLWIVFFFFFELKISNKSNRRLRGVFALGVLFVFICIIHKLVGVSSATMGYCISAPFLYFAPVLALIVIDKCNNEQQVRFLFHFLALLIVINIVDNIRLSHVYGIENIVYQRLLDMMEEEGHTGLNFGGSFFVNMTVFYACMMFMAFLRANSRKEKLLFLIYLSISSYFIIVCSLKASAVILLFISFALMYVSARSKEHIGLMLTLIAAGGGVFFFFRDSIVDFLINIIGSERVSTRLSILTTGGDMGDSSSLNTRGELWQVSLQSWLSSVSSFFFGIGEHNWKDFISTAASGVGNHSDLFDVLARYGITGALILYASIKVYYDYIKNKYGILFKFEILSFFILILLFGFTKKFVEAQPAIVIFILFPLTLNYISKQVKKR